MKRLALVLVVLAVPCLASAEHTRVTNPNNIGFEILGRGLLYSVQFDRVLNDDMAAGLGFGHVATKTAAGADSGVNANMIPAYFNYYFAREQGSIFATAGATLVLNSGDVKTLSASTGGLEFGSSAVLPTLGVGYENRGDSGFLFRFAAYALIASNVAPWAGFSFGYAF